MKDPILQKIADIVNEKSGIHLPDKKEGLVRSRIGKRLRLLKLKDYEEYLHFLMNDSSGKELFEMIDAISTNVTHFFREDKHFEFLTQLCQTYRQKGLDQMRIWCAASSTGEEPYSIAMTLIEAGMEKSKIFASDINLTVLAHAEKGIYALDKVGTLNGVIMRKYFKKGQGRAAGYIRIKPEVRRMVQFFRFNLSDKVFNMEGNFDIIFCRNVMIYFTDDLKRNILKNFHPLLKPGGFLLVGHSESMSSLTEEFGYVQPAVYQKGI